MSKRNATAIIFFTIVAVFLVFGALKVHDFGHPEMQEYVLRGSDGVVERENITVDPAMDDHIIDNCQKETGANNGVTSVVFDYRGFDTLGEATVLFTAVAGVIMIFRRLKK